MRFISLYGLEKGSSLLFCEEKVCKLSKRFYPDLRTTKIGFNITVDIENKTRNLPIIEFDAGSWQGKIKGAACML